MAQSWDFGDYSAPDVVFLRAFRDARLFPPPLPLPDFRCPSVHSDVLRDFAYLARMIERSPLRRAIVRTPFLPPIIATIRIHQRSTGLDRKRKTLTHVS